jgi:hypothetical protein
MDRPCAVCAAPADWEAFHPATPQIVDPLCQQHAELRAADAAVLTRWEPGGVVPTQHGGMVVQLTEA